jgi:major membrane immunogen (membrane-anchored lipoprotein)
MKLVLFLTKPNKLLLYWCLFILLTSCGSYQNSSYYDSDGIYGSTPRSAVQKKHKALLRTNIKTILDLYRITINQ